MESNNGTRKQFDSLQAARGAACLLVVLFHIALWEREYGISTWFLRPLRWFGFVGVDIFFVLSGFIITYAHWDQLGQRRGIAKFLVRRIWRIFPTYLFVLVGTAVVWHYSLNWPYLPVGAEEHGWRWLLLLPAETLNPIVPQSWTLRYELLFYLAFVVLFLVPIRWGVGLLAMWGLASVASGLFVPPVSLTGRFLLSPLVMEFVLGAIVAIAVRCGYLDTHRWGMILGTAGMVLGAVGWYLATGREYTFISELARVLIFSLPVALIVWGMVSLESRRAVHVPNWLMRLGDASYSIYLVHCSLHPILIVYGARMSHSANWHKVWILIAVASCVGVGYVVHFCVERPTLNCMSRKPRESVARSTRWPRLVRLLRRQVS